jgi:LPS-assembly protein
MPKTKVLPHLRRFVPWMALLLLFLGGAQCALAQTTKILPPKMFVPGETASLEADQQRAVGKIFYADGHVDISYENTRLRADHVEYNSETQTVIATGHVQLDYMTQHVEADDARYELKTGRGTFHHVRATFAVQRRPIPNLLISSNPMYFEAEEAERLDENTYRVNKAWLTGCDPLRPTWKFYASKATIKIRQSVHMENGNVRIFSVPVLYLPYASFPAANGRQSGFLIPDTAENSSKGFVLGDAYYWAPTDWMDTTIGGNLYSKRGWEENGELRMRPWENAHLEATFFGVEDRGLPQPTGPPINQGGHEAKLRFTALLPHGWRAVADLDQLTSLTFRLAWSETFVQAVNSEVLNTAFLTNNFKGFSLNFVTSSYQNYLTATPQTSITLRSAPEVSLSSVDQAPFQRLPFYFSFEGFSGAVSRSEDVTPFKTPAFVERSEFAPTVAVPFHWGPWLSVTPGFTFRSTYYGGRMQNNVYIGQGFFRETKELSVDLRPPSLERVWQRSNTKWKHVIEPDIVYSYVDGVNDFGRFVRFDEDDTLTDTNQVEYGITQRLYRRTADGDAEEVASWRIAQEYYFDPTFGGALVTGQRNVFQATDAFTPFAFADTPRNVSPILSDLRVDVGKRFDTEFIVNYDAQRQQLKAIGTLVKLKPYKESFLTLENLSTQNLPTDPMPPPPNFEQRSNQVRGLIGYGDLTRRGWNATFGASYDVTQQDFQNQIVQVNYNSSCCGVGVEYRRLSFGTIRNENQFRIVVLIANLGSAGNLKRTEKVF